MKRPAIQTEHACPACKGTGVSAVKRRAQPGRRIYPPRCLKCLGKGRIEKAANRGGLTWPRLH